MERSWYDVTAHSTNGHLSFTTRKQIMKKEKILHMHQIRMHIFVISLCEYHMFRSFSGDVRQRCSRFAFCFNWILKDKWNVDILYHSNSTCVCRLGWVYVVRGVAHFKSRTNYETFFKNFYFCRCSVQRAHLLILQFKFSKGGAISLF